jgi:hypothetical protein
MIVNGNANAKTGKKETQRCKGARTQGKKKTGKKETQRCKGARAQGKPGSQNLKEHFHGAFLPAILCHPPSYLLPCAFASLRFLLCLPCVLAPLHLCVSFFSSLRFGRLDTKKNQPTRGLGESADGCFLEEASERRVD